MRARVGCARAAERRVADARPRRRRGRASSRGDRRRAGTAASTTSPLASKTTSSGIPISSVVGSASTTLVRSLSPGCSSSSTSASDVGQRVDEAGVERAVDDGVRVQRAATAHRRRLDLRRLAVHAHDVGRVLVARRHDAQRCTTRRPWAAPSQNGALASSGPGRGRRSFPRRLAVIGTCRRLRRRGASGRSRSCRPDRRRTRPRRRCRSPGHRPGAGEPLRRRCSGTGRDRWSTAGRWR